MTLFCTLITLSAIPALSLAAPASQTPRQDTTAYAIVQVAPEFAGGSQALFRFIQQTSHYPVIPPDKQPKGTLVVVRALVEKDGTLSRPVIHYSAAEGAYEQEALRIVSRMPAWKPGSQDGHPLRAYTQIPFRFVAGPKKP
ncbi:energy transducer TonB [Arsenicibacter rosenii]|uniref:TonB C-terminal domain-containing protein n=1 Tax=Arsenicibacter rosenii TaxID=1750698 RepID=A0A1S2VQK6_9BACT|nr:energy transducer TonB [Arsenicibacter rosenii]OIN60485.1 hypothetical protein BLX24_06610 [Arsenicibacter rosenii]